VSFISPQGWQKRHHGYQPGIRVFACLDGPTWAQIVYPLLARWVIGGSGDNLFVMGTSGGLTIGYWSDDAGATWTQALTFPSVAYGNNGGAGSFATGSGFMFMGLNATQVAVSSDNGKTWTLVAAGSIATSGRPCYDPATDRVWYPGTGVAPANRKLVQFSTAGVVGVSADTGVIVSTYCDGGATQQGSGNLVFVGSAGCLVSSDDGATWTPTVIGWPSAEVGQSVDRSTSGTLIAAMSPGANKHLRRSTDGGLTWSTIALPGSFPAVVYSIVFKNGVFIGVSRTTGDVILSIDDGLTWTRFAAGSGPHALAYAVAQTTTTQSGGNWFTAGTTGVTNGNIGTC
jgi:photosystem II stability/assembly factor-like uncharacterized protein